MEYPHEIKVTVTERHIGDGITRSCTKCPLALALIEMGYNTPYVTYDEVMITGPETYSVYTTDQAAKNLISTFDSMHEYIETPIDITLRRKL